MTEISQQWNAQDYARNAGFVPALGEPVLELLAVVPGERILDVGCGDGVLTKKLVGAGANVIGVDHSPEMIAASRALGLDARMADATALSFDAEFDAVFTNATLHWVKANPEACVVAAFRALKPGGRFVGEFGGHGCVAAVVVALLAELERPRRLRCGGANPLVLPNRRGVSCAARGSGLPCGLCCRDSAPDSASDRHERMARNLRQPILRCASHGGTGSVFE